MTDVFRTIIVPNDYVGLARKLTSTLSPIGGVNMYETGLSPTGTMPATHWISSGYIAEEYAALMPLYEWIQEYDEQQQPIGSLTRNTVFQGQPETIIGYIDAIIAGYAELEEPPVDPVTPVPIEVIQSLFDNSDITMEEPFAAINRLNLKITSPEEV